MNINKAIIKALVNTGNEILEEDYNGFIVGKHDGDILFIEPQTHIGEIVNEVEVQHSRFDFETASCMYLANHEDIVDCCVLFDVAQLFVLSPSRGMLRHVMNWPNASDIKCKWNIIMLEGRE